MKRLLKVGVVTTALLVLTAVPALAQDQAAAIDNLESMAFVLYLMVATVLVFIMHAGFALLEAGFTRSKNAANIVGKNLLTLTIGLLTYYAIGWGLMYGEQVAGLFGSDSFFLAGSSYVPDATLEMDFAFQAMFAATAATIVSGAVAERMKFGAYLAVAVVMTGLIYPIVGAWTWGGGWIAGVGFADFAGSTIVHLTGGVAALVGAIFLGARIGKFDPKSGKARAIPGHSMPLAALGTLLLFFGWFGFNGGSVLNAEVAVGPVLLTTALAASTGGLTAAAVSALRGRGKTDLTMTGNGILAGLVGITAGADVVAPWAALLVGVVAGVVVTVAVLTVERMRVDDAVGAFSVHGVCGVLGTWWVGLFAVGDGLFYGGGFELLGVHVLGTLAVALFVVATVAPICLALKAAGLLRVPDEVQAEGLDLHEHGVSGYPEPAAVGAGPAAGR